MSTASRRAVTDPNGVATTLSYDVRGRLRTRTVNAGNATAETTAFDYDSAGQLVRVTMPDGSSLRYQYDAAHRLTEIADGLGNVIQYTLDAMGNRIKEDVFDPADRLVRTQRRIYDALNRLYNDIGAAGQMSAYLYDGNGNLKTSIDPLNRNTTINYDALNRLLNSTDAAGGVIRYGYDAKDRLISVQDPINLTTTYAYDGLGNLTQTVEPGHGCRDLRARCRRQRRRSDRCARAWRRATSMTRSIARRWRPSPAAALRSSTTARRPAAHLPGAG